MTDHSKKKNFYFLLFILLQLLLYTARSWASLSSQTGASTLELGRSQLGSYKTSLNNTTLNHASFLFNNPAGISDVVENEYSFSLFTLQSNFKKTNSIVLQNTATTGSDTKTGNYNPNMATQLMMSITATYRLNWSFLSTTNHPTFGIGLIAPLPELAIIQSKSPMLPHYLWYDPRLTQSEIFMTYAQHLGSNSEHSQQADWNISIGSHVLWDVKAESEVITSINGNTAPSQSQISGHLKPRLRLQGQVTRNWNNFNCTSVQLWQQSQQKVTNDVSGRAPLGNQSSLDYGFIMNATTGFDPWKIRLEHIWKLPHSSSQFNFAMDYEDWTNYATPYLTMTHSRGIIQNSNNQEKIKGKKIISPAIAYEYSMENYGTWHFSYRYMPKIWEKDDAHSGNSIDRQRHILGTAFEYQWNQQLSYTVGAQLHLLNSKQIHKSNFQENGSVGSKIGAPGYTAGGQFYAFALGINWKL